MAEKLKIKLSVANRVYPLTIHPSQEEGLRKASQEINNMIKQFEENYSVRDKQDALAMCALQIAVQSSKEADANTTSQSDVHKKIVLLSKYLTEQLAS